MIRMLRRQFIRSHGIGLWMFRKHHHAARMNVKIQKAREQRRRMRAHQKRWGLNR